MPIAISPHFTEEKLHAGATLENLVDVFEDQILGWLLEPANHLKSEQHAGFAILAIVLSYFEPIGKALGGKRGGSKGQFSRGLRAVFPGLGAAESDAAVGELYEQLRCGMFHSAITRERVVISPASEHVFVIEKNTDGSLKRVTVTPVNLMHHLEVHVREYVAQLRNPANNVLRSNFVKWFMNRAG